MKKRNHNLKYKLKRSGVVIINITKKEKYNPISDLLQPETLKQLQDIGYYNPDLLNNILIILKQNARY